MKFNRIFLALVCSISLLGVACSDGDSTSSNTPSANNNGSADNNGGDEVSDDNNGGESQTFTIDGFVVPDFLGGVTPAPFGQSFTVVRGETTEAELEQIQSDARSSCSQNFTGDLAATRQECIFAVNEAILDALQFLEG